MRSRSSTLAGLKVLGSLRSEMTDSRMVQPAIRISPDDVLILLVLAFVVPSAPEHDGGVHISRAEGVGLVEQRANRQQDGTTSIKDLTWWCFHIPCPCPWCPSSAGTWRRRLRWPDWRCWARWAARWLTAGWCAHSALGSSARMAAPRFGGRPPAGGGWRYTNLRSGKRQ